jgi:hypothetical protein
MAQTKPKAAQFYGVSDNGTDGQFLKTDGTGGMSWDSPITNPTITSIDYPGSATAADPAGGESVIINGTLFASGITCTVGGTSAVTAFNSATQITITTPAKAAGPYTVAVLNPDGGTASENNFIQYSGVPVWSTAAGTLGNVLEGEAASFQVTATEGSDTIEYAVTTGTLPTGLSLATATGAITGTAPAVSADTTTTFSITATDDENQTSASRSFSITVQNDGPSNHFNTVLYSGNGGTQSITGVGFQPDLVWGKSRNDTISHILFDVVRGENKQLSSNTTGAEVTRASAAYEFDSDGFTVTTAGNLNNAVNYVAWNFKAGGAATTIAANTVGNTIASDVSVNNTLGFSIASYTGNGIAGSTVGHGLDSTPEMVIVKSITSTANGSWSVYHISTGATKSIALEQATTPFTDIGYWNNTSPTASVFSLGTYAVANQSSANYIAYNFTSKPGFSKVGTYTGNGSASGPMVQTGFEPAFIMLKPTSIADNWMIYDNKRGDNKVLFPNLSNAESTYDGRLSFLANGFQITTTNSGWNGSGQTYIYLAIAADGSTATPSLANSFATEIYTGNGGTQSVTTGFKPDLVWLKGRNATWSHFLQDSVRGAGNYLISNSTGAAGTTVPNIVSSFDTNGFTVLGNGNSNNNNDTYVSWNWKAGGTPSINTDGTMTSLVSVNQAAGFSIVQQTSNSSNDTIGHGLSAAPELIISKNQSISGPWGVYNASNGVNGFLYFNQTNAWTSAPTVYPIVNSTVFSGGSGGWNYGTGNVYINYCFTSISGYSKVGTYNGSGSAGNAQNVGFQPDFLLLKATNVTSNWSIYDSKRGGDNRLIANSSAAESVLDSANFTSTGFEFTDAAYNNTGETYIYLAIKEN